MYWIFACACLTHSVEQMNIFFLVSSVGICFILDCLTLIYIPVHCKFSVYIVNIFLIYFSFLFYLNRHTSLFIHLTWTYSGWKTFLDTPYITLRITLNSAKYHFILQSNMVPSARALLCSGQNLMKHIQDLTYWNF